MFLPNSEKKVPWGSIDMCGRFTLILPPELIAGILGLAELTRIEHRYNIVPSQQVAAIRTLADKGIGNLSCRNGGSFPPVAKDRSAAGGMISGNAT